MKSQQVEEIESWAFMDVYMNRPQFLRLEEKRQDLAGFTKSFR